jgi:hypothetical protein
MCRVLVSLLLFPLFLGACAVADLTQLALVLVGDAVLYIPSPSLTRDQTDAQSDARYAQFDARLTEMAGANERQLLGAMGRVPDNSYQLDDLTKVLQWRWDETYISPSCSPTYHGRPSGGYPPSLVHESCVVDWTVTKGTSQTYHWVGYGCRSVTLVSYPVP